MKVYLVVALVGLYPEDSSTYNVAAYLDQAQANAHRDLCEKHYGDKEIDPRFYDLDKSNEYVVEEVELREQPPEVTE